MNGILELLNLVQNLGEIEGRKKLQKIVYILQTQGYDFPQDFNYFHYGPYSSDVAFQVDRIVSWDLVKETRGADPYEPYVYTPRETLPAFLAEVKAATTAPWKSLARKLNEKDANFLETLATALYLQRDGLAGDKLERRFGELKPHLAGQLLLALKYARDNKILPGQ
jgi:uncharacterized protein